MGVLAHFGGLLAEIVGVTPDCDGYVPGVGSTGELRLADAAAVAGVTSKALQLAVEAGDLTARRDGRRLLIERSDLFEWIERHGLVPREVAADGVWRP